MNQGFGQFCPIALASEILTQRWMLLVLHQFMMGSTRFNEIRRGVPKISATLLKLRLQTLENAEIIEKRPIADTSNYEYFLTESGKELEGTLTQVGTWGQRWARAIEDDDLDPGWLVWNMHRRLNIAEIPSGRTVIHIEFDDVKNSERYFWLVVNDGKVDVCVKNPGFESDITLTSTVRTLAKVWRGILPLNTEIKDGHIRLEGKPALIRAFPKWLLLSNLAHIKPAKTKAA